MSIRERLSDLRPHVSPAGELPFRQLAALAETAEALARDEHARAERLVRLVERTASLVAAPPADLGEAILEALVDGLAADRGLLATAHPEEGWQVVAARFAGGAPWDAPTWSTGVLERALAANGPFVTADAAGDAALGLRHSVATRGIRSACCMPVTREGVTQGFVWLENRLQSGLFDGDSVRLATAWLPILSEVLDRAHRRAHGVRSPLPGFLTRSAEIAEELGELARMAAGRSTLLLCGEPGVGKRTIARILHRISPSGAGPFVALDAGSAEIEASLFGTEDAEHGQAGALEDPAGTLYLTDIDALPPAPRPDWRKRWRTAWRFGWVASGPTR